MTESRDFLIKKLKKNNIPSAIYYPLPMDRQKVFNKSKNYFTPQSYKISKKILSLPFGPYLKISDQKKIFNILKKYKSKI